MIVSSYFNKPQHNVVKRQKDHDLVSDSFCYWRDKYFLFADITYNYEQIERIVVDCQGIGTTIAV